MKKTIINVTICASLLMLGACASTQKTTGVESVAPVAAAQSASPASPVAPMASVDPLKDPYNVLSKRVIYFDFDKATIRPESFQILNNLVSY